MAGKSVGPLHQVMVNRRTCPRESQRIGATRKQPQPQPAQGLSPGARIRFRHEVALVTGGASTSPLTETSKSVAKGTNDGGGKLGRMPGLQVVSSRAGCQDRQIARWACASTRSCSRTGCGSRATAAATVHARRGCPRRGFRNSSSEGRGHALTARSRGAKATPGARTSR